ncbi:MAG: methylenetetrahydrofolate reductase [Clostridia bacterium]|nr:methylenetetrahydrofolate reductase [Clostridia bacterium]
MLIKDILNSKPVTFSCELFPPKVGTDLQKADMVVEKTAALRPDFISVTCGANGGNTENVLRMAKHANDCGSVGLAHLTCVSASREGIAKRIAEMKDAGIYNVLALRGDLPEGMEKPEDACFQHANELVELLKGSGEFSVGGACYPECHPESASQAEDIINLKRKVDAGCDFLTTQMFFDNDLLYRFLNKLSKAGVDVPIIAGIMPVTSGRQVARITGLSGALMPPRFRNMLDCYGNNDAAMEQAGIAYACEQIADLVANGIRGIHIYTMNKPEIAGKILNNLSSVLMR